MTRSVSRTRLGRAHFCPCFRGQIPISQLARGRSCDPANRGSRHGGTGTAATYFRTLTARAMTNATVTSEIADCPSMVSFAHRDNGMTSVGLNAVAFVNDT